MADPFETLTNLSTTSLDKPVVSGYDVSVFSLLNDVNNIQELANFTNHGWVGSDPLFSHVYFFQPALRDGNYIPRQLVKGVNLPIKELKKDKYHLKGREISFTRGSNISDLEVVYYENQQMQVTAFHNAWLANIDGPGGSYVQMPSEYKEMMIFLHNQSFGNPITTITNDLAYKLLPNHLLNTIEFAGITIMIGVYPQKSPGFNYENMKQNSACEFSIKYNVDEMFQFPLSVDVSSIMQILGFEDTSIFTI